VKFPKKIKYRGRVYAKIYGKSAGYPFYRLAYYVAGRRHISSFRTYGAAKSAGDKKAKELHKGSQEAAFTPAQSRDALAALQHLETFRQSTGRSVSLLGVVSEWTESAAKLNGHTLGEAVDGFLRNEASIRRKDIGEAVEEFIKAAAPLSKATEGKRAQLAAKYAYNRDIQLRRFAGAFPGTAVCDLSKELLDKFIGALDDFSPKTRNHHRATVRQFLNWAVRKDYLSATNRLGEADGLRPERSNTAETEFYTPKEFASLLAAADGNLQALIAIGGLAGLRTSELLSLDWSDVWRVAKHIEVTAKNAKTRQRRLVPICPALAAWLKPFRSLTTGSLWEMHEVTFQEHFGEACGRAKVARKTNGLRHAFCTYHFAKHANENLTAAQAGNSPVMIHGHYKGLATKAEAEKWFAVRPTAPAKAAKNIIPLSVGAK
jgi:integrase